MTKALTIEPGGVCDVIEIGDNPLEQLQGLVGGYIEPIHGQGFTMWINEEGKLRSDAADTYNGLATDLVRAVIQPGDWIAGSAVFVGPSDDEGNDTDVPDSLVAKVRRFPDAKFNG